MPRYFFEVQDGADYIDQIGVDLPELDAARRHAARNAGHPLDVIDVEFWNGREWQMRVRDEAGGTLFTLFFKAVNAQGGDDKA